jgi:hypothetical protein
LQELCRLWELCGAFYPPRGREAMQLEVPFRETLSLAVGIPSEVNI